MWATGDDDGSVRDAIMDDGAEAAAVERRALTIAQGPELTRFFVDSAPLAHPGSLRQLAFA